jgi:hypothetical protein
MKSPSLEAEGLKETKPAARGRGKKNTPPKPRVPEEKLAEVTPPEPLENKYAPKEKIGKPTLGRSPNYVEKVGLGGLKVIHNGRDPGTYS